MTWVKNVAFARISTSRNRDADCGMIFSRASPTVDPARGKRGRGRSGRANRTRQGSVDSQRRNAPPGPAGRRPMTWSRRLIAFRSGSRWAADHGLKGAVVTRMIGCDPAARPSSSAFPAPESGRTMKASALRFLASSRSSRPWPIASGSWPLPGGRHHNDEDFAVGDRFALGGEVERVNPVVFRRRPLRAGDDSHAKAARGASH